MQPKYPYHVITAPRCATSTKGHRMKDFGLEESATKWRKSSETAKLLMFLEFSVIIVIVIQSRNMMAVCANFTFTCTAHVWRTPSAPPKCVVVRNSDWSCQKPQQLPVEPSVAAFLLVLPPKMEPTSIQRTPLRFDMIKAQQQYHYHHNQRFSKSSHAPS